METENKRLREALELLLQQFETVVNLRGKWNPDQYIEWQKVKAALAGEQE
jgi:hypothetical protein